MWMFIYRVYSLYAYTSTAVKSVLDVVCVCVL